jgi:hypothetical protein
MLHNSERIGSFTSSEIVALTCLAKDKKSLGKPALTYIEETNYERKLGRSISDETNAKPLTWGNLVESHVFNLLGPDYIPTSGKTDVHPIFSFWAGSKDGIKRDEGKTVFDIKSPITLKSFCQLVDPLYNGFDGMEAMNIIRDTHKDGEKYYWQIVSNSILCGAKYGELIPYMPYKSELEDIRLLAMNASGEEIAKYSWIQFAREDELPFLIDGGYYKNLNKIRFEIPREDINFLTGKVIEAGKLLINI